MFWNLLMQNLQKRVSLYPLAQARPFHTVATESSESELVDSRDSSVSLPLSRNGVRGEKDV